MKAWLMALVLGRRGELVILPPFTKNATVPIPQGVSRLESIVGKGAAGTPGGTYPDSTQFVDAASVQATNINGNGPFPPMSWNEIDSGWVRDLQSKINAGGSGASGIGYIGYTGYTGDGTAYWALNAASWTDAIAGTATTVYSGWGSGFIIAGANGTGRVRYTRKGSSYGPSTGASATGFGQTFVGGTGGPATAREVKNVAVTPGGSYQVVVPSGGSIVISYYL